MLCQPLISSQPGGAFSLVTLFKPNEFSINLHTKKPGWSLVYISGSQVLICKKLFPKKFCIFFPTINFVLANSVDPDEMPLTVVFHLRSSLFAKVNFVLANSADPDEMPQ